MFRPPTPPLPQRARTHLLSPHSCHDLFLTQANKKTTLKKSSHCFTRPSVTGSCVCVSTLNCISSLAFSLAFARILFCLPLFSSLPPNHSLWRRFSVHARSPAFTSLCLFFFFFCFLFLFGLVCCSLFGFSVSFFFLSHSLASFPQPHSRLLTPSRISSVPSYLSLVFCCCSSVNCDVSAFSLSFFLSSLFA